MNEKDLNVLHDNFMDLMRQIASKFFKKVELIIKELNPDITTEQAIAMIIVTHHEGLSQQEISHIVRHDKTMLTRLIDNLEEKNWVVRVQDKADRRRNMIYLTNEGKIISREFLEVFKEIEKQALAGVSKKDVEFFKNIQKKILKNLE